MDLSIQSELMNVSNLDRSIEFYREVFELRLASRSGQVAALMITETSRRQVLMLHELSSRNPNHPGRGTVGLSLLSLEAGSLHELQLIEQRLVERHAYSGRVRTEGYEAVIGIDPDGIKFSVASALTGAPITSEDWIHIDDAIYEVAE